MKFLNKRIDVFQGESNLSRSNDDIVNRNENQLDEKTDKSHHDETNCGTERHFGEFCAKIGAAINQIAKQNRIDNVVPNLYSLY